MILKAYVDEPFDLPAALYFAYLSRVNYVQRVISDHGFTEHEVSALSFAREMPEEW